MSNVLFRCMFLAVMEHLRPGFGPGYVFRREYQRNLSCTLPYIWLLKMELSASSCQSINFFFLRFGLLLTSDRVPWYKQLELEVSISKKKETHFLSAFWLKLNYFGEGKTPLFCERVRMWSTFALPLLPKKHLFSWNGLLLLSFWT